MSIDREAIKDRLRPGTGEPDDGYISDTDFFGVIDDLADEIEAVADGTKLGPDSVSQGNLAPNSVGPSEIQSKAVAADEIDDAAIIARHVADGALPAAKISGLATVATSGQYANLSGRPTLGTAAALNTGTGTNDVVKGDDARLSNTRTPTDSSVTDAKVAATAAIAPSKIDPARVTFDNANYTIPSAARMVAQVGTMTAPRTVTLPLANTVAAGYVITVKDASGTVGGTNTITVARAGSNLINGAATGIVINTAYSGRQFVSNGVDGWTALITPAQVIYGDAANTAAQGNDPRIVGAASAALIGNRLPANVATGTDTLGTTAGFQTYAGKVLASSTAYALPGGLRSLRVPLNGSNAAVGWAGVSTVFQAANVVPVVQGVPVTCIAHVMSPSQTKTLRYILYWWKADGTASATPLTNGATFTTSSTFTRQELTALPPADAAFVTATISNGVGATWTSGDEYYIDGISLHVGAGGQVVPPGMPVPGLGFRADPTNPAQVQVHVPGTANTWVTV